MNLTRRLFIPMLSLLWLAGPPAPAWTPAQQVDTEQSASGRPAIAYDSTGRLHCVYAGNPTGSNPILIHRSLVGDEWSEAVDLPGPNYKEPGADLAVDAHDHLHVAGIYRADGTMDTPYTVHYWEHDGVAWSGPVQLSPGTGGDSHNCGSVSIAVDRLNDVHVLWSQGGATGGAGDIMYRKRQAGVWLAARNITANPSGYSYGSAAPDMAVDAGGDAVHVVWHDDFAVSTRLYYTRNTGLGDPAAWLPSSEWVQLSCDEYGKGPVLVLDRLNRPHVFWTDTFNAGLDNKRLAYRHFDGTGWVPAINLGSGPFNPEAAFDAANRMHCIYMQNGVQYRTYDYSAFSNPVQISSGVDTYKADAGVIRLGCLTDNPIVVWEERKGEWPGVGHVFWTRHAGYSGPTGTLGGVVRDQNGNGVPGATVYAQTGDSVLTGPGGAYALALPPGTMKVSATKRYYSTQTETGVIIAAGQTTPRYFTIETGLTPGAVTAFTATAGSTQVALRWQNPPEAGLNGTLIRFSTGGYPTGPSDGALVVDQPATPGTQGSFTHSGLANGITCWYAAFARFDNVYSPGAHAFATPAVRPDMDRDGDVDQADFGLFQACLSGEFIPQRDLDCQKARLDADEDVDPYDVALFLYCWSGPGLYADPQCGN